MAKEYNVLIVGFGIVGKNLSKEIWQLHPDIYDKYHKEFNSKRDINYDVAFICVDTPATENDMLDTYEVENALYENDANIYVVKSTLPMTGIEYLHTRFPNKDIVYSPEYYGATQHCENIVFNFTILGGNKNTCYKVQQILQECYDARHTFHITDSRTAELCKLMENAWLATVVSFCTQMFEVCKDYEINYEELRELFILDPRVNPSHTFVYENHPYWDSHCLNKDVAYLANWADAKLLQDVVKFNNEQRRKYGG